MTSMLLELEHEELVTVELSGPSEEELASQIIVHVKTMRQGNYTIALATALIEGQKVFTMGISKYNPADKHYIAKDRYGKPRLNKDGAPVVLSLDKTEDMGNKIAQGRALAAIKELHKQKSFNTYIKENDLNAAMIPAGSNYSSRMDNLYLSLPVYSEDDFLRMVEKQEKDEKLRAQKEADRKASLQKLKKDERDDWQYTR